MVRVLYRFFKMEIRIWGLSEYELRVEKRDLRLTLEKLMAEKGKKEEEEEEEVSFSPRWRSVSAWKEVYFSPRMKSISAREGGLFQPEEEVSFSPRRRSPSAQEGGVLQPWWVLYGRNCGWKAVVGKEPKHDWGHDWKRIMTEVRGSGSRSISKKRTAQQQAVSKSQKQYFIGMIQRTRRKSRCFISNTLNSRFIEFKVTNFFHLIKPKSLITMA